MTELLPYTLNLTLAFFCILSSCSGSGKEVPPANKGNHKLAYDLKTPDAVYELPDILREISGISWFRDNKIACIQDEKGIVFLFDIKKEKVSASYKFGKPADYEDIAITNDTAWVLESNGTIYKVTNFFEDNRKTFVYPTILSAKNNTEGLVYDKGENNLLIACKNEPSIKGQKKLTGFKAIYSFSTSDNKLKEKPEFLIDLASFTNLKEKNYFAKVSSDLAKTLNLTDDAVFRPSGLAIHPIDDELYIISATPGKLIVMSRNGDIRYITTLGKQLFSQAEGICFSPEGDLYISNEGKYGNGNILKFNNRAR